MHNQLSIFIQIAFPVFCENLRLFRGLCVTKSCFGNLRICIYNSTANTSLLFLFSAKT